MQRWTDLAQVPADFGPSVVTVGNFDGVHRGHVGVLTRMVADARAVGARSVAVTFTPHPQQVHRPETAPPLLTGDADRLELLEQTGLDAVLLLTYTLDFAQQTAEEFVRTHLVEGLRARTVVVGRDVRFGRGNAGDLSTMVELGERFGFAVEVIEDVAPDPADAAAAPDAPADPASALADPLRRRWSSTWVRELLVAGDVRQAARVLGRPHRMRGTVVHGDKRGRDLGFPTANLSQDATGMVPADGVYAGWLRRPGVPAGSPDAVLPAAVSVGTNPTFAGLQRRVEAYVLDRTDLDLYGEEVVLEFVERLRPTLRFDSVDELVERMHQDVAGVREVLAGAAG
ncbi:bifunctional riboflavin kinase/FAD synthetase [Cellulomonas pakistanensis]|uniref:Riboflavin biosynthesis protein n=1 Tax=Cellulomonas pakistanensis TaxID=992287 RepID=A0A919PE27_9CELL|nr:bifunctional riboflavin kinase/FAD synthetase [Cellulomonas pakistanensis]GIG37865.1 riboflavin biosynthesis protein [Cellulomonas pakistanensis]